jgi:hypothetical protein
MSLLRGLRSDLIDPAIDAGRAPERLCGERSAGRIKGVESDKDSVLSPLGFAVRSFGLWYDRDAGRRAIRRDRL